MMRSALIGGFLLVSGMCWSQVERYNLTHQAGWEVERFGSGLTFLAEGGVMSSAVSNSIISAALRGGTITQESTSYLTGSNSERKSLLNATLYGEAWGNFALKGSSHLTVVMGAREVLFGQSTVGLTQLALTGNASFEGLSLPLGPTRLQYLSYQYLGAGYDKAFEKFVFGFSGQLIKLSRWQELRLDDGSFYTAPYGEFLQVQAEATRSYTSSDQQITSAWYGTGGSLRAFVSNSPAEGKPYFSIALEDLGMVHLRGYNQQRFSIDTTFQGVVIDDLNSNVEAPTGLSMASIDSILGAVEERGKGVVWLPAHVMIQIALPLGSKAALNLTTKQFFMNIPPMVQGGLRMNVARWASFEPYLIAGGFARANVGIKGYIKVSDNMCVQLNYGMVGAHAFPQQSRSRVLSLIGNVRF